MNNIIIIIIGYLWLTLDYVAILGIISVAWIQYLVFFKIIVIVWCIFICAYMWLLIKKPDLIDYTHSFIREVKKDKVLFKMCWYNVMNNIHILANVFLIGISFAYEYILFGLLLILCICLGKLYRKCVHNLCDVLEDVE